MAAEDDPFDLIKKGNAFEAASDHWRSADFYSRASITLKSRADDISSQLRAAGIIDDTATQEKRKVVSLFRAQSLEYMYKARHCLLEALRFENEQDRSRTLEVAKSGQGSLDPLFSMISTEESDKRKLIFQRLFTQDGEPIGPRDQAAITQTETKVESTNENVVESTDGDRDKHGGESDGNASETEIVPSIESSDNGDKSSAESGEIDDRQQSIESRLAKLDSSLLPKAPPPFISGSRGSGGGDSQNRIEEIQRGLKGLGVTLPDNGKKSGMLPEKLSAEEQVKLIIQQAQDEVRVEKGLHAGEGESNNENNGTNYLDDDDDDIDENNSMFDGFVEDDDDDDMNIEALLAKAENLVSKTGALGGDGDDQSSDELVNIRRAQALLLEARLCLELVQKKPPDEQILSEKVEKGKDKDKQGEDVSDNNSEGSNESEDRGGQYANGPNLAARKKAKELIESAQDCMKSILEGWR